MIVIKTNTLAACQLSISETTGIKKMIELASDHPAASSGEALAFKFLKSVDGDGEVNIHDVLYYFEANVVCACLTARSRGVMLSEFWEIIELKKASQDKLEAINKALEDYDHVKATKLLRALNGDTLDQVLTVIRAGGKDIKQTNNYELLLYRAGYEIKD